MKLKLDINLLKAEMKKSKIEAHEATRMMEEMKKQLVMKDEDYEKFKGEVVFLKKEVDLLNKNLKSSQTLDDIPSHQSSPDDKSRLHYAGESSSKNDNVSKNKDVRNP